MRRRLGSSLLVLALLVPATGEAQSSASRTPTKSATASGGATKSTSASRSSSKTKATKQATASKPRVAKPVVASAAKRPAPKAAPIRSAVPTDATALRNHLHALVNSSTKSGRWGVMVVSITRGDTLFGHNADAMLLPASTMKLYTSAVALERFGPAHQFRTEVLRDGAVLVDGTVQGDLILKGAGDPSLAPRFAAWSSGQRPMDALADQVVRAGITRVKGDIIGDASAFETQRVPDGWRTRYLQASYAARVSALSFNENLAHITVRPSTRGAVVAFGQAVSGLKLNSSVTVRPNTAGASVRVWQDTLTQQFRVSGWIGARSRTRTYQVVVEQPERYVAAAFRAALEARGIQVDGVVRDGAASSSAQRVTTWASAPLAQLVATMNGESNNHFAELLFRNAARTDSVVGSAATGNASLEKFLFSRVGVARGAVHAADGSGLSTLDRVTPRSMVQLLGYGITAPWGQVLQQSLPIAGRTETLRGRMRGTAAQGNLRAKTGTTNEVTSLGGYVTSRNGEELAFSFLYNGRELWRARAAIDAMGVTLASFSR
ncbi:MAG: D-alanyl-D-alanine carboxypeptidase/D-alanyl-D-alanine-endopeptidase [Gemmatimonadaceae bacterium]